MRYTAFKELLAPTNAQQQALMGSESPKESEVRGWWPHSSSESRLPLVCMHHVTHPSLGVPGGKPRVLRW
jgi:hypothetical protein